MLAELAHLLWLFASAAAAVGLLRPGLTPSQPLRLLATAALAAAAADGVAWALGHTFLHPVAAAAGGLLMVTMAWTSAAGDPATGPTPDKSQDDDSQSRALGFALNRWPEACALAAADGSFLWANPPWLQQHGVSELQGTTWRDFQASSDSSRWEFLLEDADKDGAAVGLLQHAGPTRWGSRSYLIALEEGDDKLYFIASIRMSDDEANLRRETREVSHNLNNVLSAVVGNVGLALETPGLDPGLQTDLREAEHGGLRAAELIHQLQALARGES